MALKSQASWRRMPRSRCSLPRATKTEPPRLSGLDSHACENHSDWWIWSPQFRRSWHATTKSGRRLTIVHFVGIQPIEAVTDFPNQLLDSSDGLLIRAETQQRAVVLQIAHELFAFLHA